MCAEEGAATLTHVLRCPFCGSAKKTLEKELPSSYPTFQELWKCTACKRHFVIWMDCTDTPDAAGTERTVQCPACGEHVPCGGGEGDRYPFEDLLKPNRKHGTEATSPDDDPESADASKEGLKSQGTDGHEEG